MVVKKFTQINLDNMNKYLAVFIFLILIHLSCSVNNIDPLDESFIRKISQEDVHIPSQFSNVAFFCKGLNHTILFLNVNQLREIHQSKFANITYYDFLTDALNQKIIIKSIQYNNFKIDKTIDRLYNRMNINEFRDLFCIQRGADIYYLKRDINDIQRNTVLYYLFIHNYLTRLDDYSGAFIIGKNN
jgi:hypothetical protein